MQLVVPSAVSAAVTMLAMTCRITFQDSLFFIPFYLRLFLKVNAVVL